MAENKGVNMSIGGKKIDNIATKVGEAIDKADKAAGDKIKVDVGDIGKKIDKAVKNVDLGKLKK